MKHLTTRISLVLFLFLVVTVGISAQSSSFYFVNETNIEIDREAVANAAQPIIERQGANVAVYAVVVGNERDLTARLADDNLNDFLGLRNDTLALYFATENRYSEIRWGSELDKLEGSTIRSDFLNPALRDGQYTQGLVDALGAIDRRLTNPLVDIQKLFAALCTSPIFWFIALFSAYALLATKMGWSKGSGTNYGEGGWTGDSGSSGAGGSGGHSNGGGSDAGSWGA